MWRTMCVCVCVCVCVFFLWNIDMQKVSSVILFFKKDWAEEEQVRVRSERKKTKHKETGKGLLDSRCVDTLQTW